MTHATSRLRRSKGNRRMLLDVNGHSYRESQLEVLGSRSSRGLSDRGIIDLAMHLNWPLHEVKPILHRVVGYVERGTNGESGSGEGYLA